MAYISKDLNLVAPAVGAGQGGSVWSYVNADVDSLAAQRAADFFSDGGSKGMKVGDSVISSDTAGVGGVLRVDAINANGLSVTVT